jgi:hypothetical protein
MARKSRFAAERAAFGKLKRAVEKDPDLRGDIELAIGQLHERFATSIRENRFIVGGVLEVVLVAALRAAGVKAEDVGTSEQRIDIKIPDGGFSVKGHFKRTGDIRLINVLGESSATEWDTATLFVLHGIGIGYADPDLIGETKRTSDAVVLRYAALRDFLRQNPKYLIVCDIPPARRDAAGSELVSRSIAREILKGTKKLANYMP